MINEIFYQGIELGRERFAYIIKRGSKWKNRNIPVFIRSRLMVPYYITDNGSEFELWIINYPMGALEKVSFTCFATAPHEASTIYVCSKRKGQDP